MAILKEGAIGARWIDSLLSHIRIPPACVLHLAPQPNDESIYPPFRLENVGTPKVAVLRPMPSTGINLTPATFHNDVVHIDSSDSLDVAITRVQNYLGSVSMIYISTAFLSRSHHTRVRKVWTAIESHAPTVKEVVFRGLSDGIGHSSETSTVLSGEFKGTPILRRLCQLSHENEASIGGQLSRVYLPPLNSTRLPPPERDLVSKFGRKGDNIIGGVTVTVGGSPPDAPANPYAAMLLDRQLDVADVLVG